MSETINLLSYAGSGVEYCNFNLPILKARKLLHRPVFLSNFVYIWILQFFRAYSLMPLRACERSCECVHLWLCACTLAVQVLHGDAATPLDGQRFAFYDVNASQSRQMSNEKKYANW